MYSKLCAEWRKVHCYWAVEADPQILRGPIMPAHFHSFYDGTDSPSDLIEPVGAANAIPRAEVGP